VAVVVVAAAIAGAWLALRASLPRTGGHVQIDGLSAPVHISRDALGVPTIAGETFNDVALGQGFVHAQDRFFQMDAARRYTAGELAALFGEPLVGVDRRMRARRYRRLAREALAEMPARHRAALEAYTRGVNAGLADLGARPPEYLLLRARPQPWRAEDCVLLVYFFYEGLTLNDRFEKSVAVMADTLPPALVEFLTPDVSRFDAPLITGVGTVRDPAPVPGPEVVDLRGAEPVRPARDVVRPVGTTAPGSNNWAIAGSGTAHGGAIVANDPHLVLGVPNVWYRCALEWGSIKAQGVGPPGVPGVTIGASQHLAWGVTNSIVDQIDLVVVEEIALQPGWYLTPDGPRQFEIVNDTVEVKGGTPRPVEIRLTRWGPVVDNDHRGRPLAMRARFLEPGGADLALLDLPPAETLDDGLAIARRWRGPSLNWLLADDGGRIAWVVGGYLARRVGFDGRTPVSWADGACRWDGALDETLRPTIVDPAQGVLFTANHRTVPVDLSRRLGRVWMPPLRANRIAHLLGDPKTAPWSERDCLAVQLDTRSVVHELARDLVLEAAAGEPGFARVRGLAESWNGTADADERGFALLHQYYDRLQEHLLVPLLAPAIEADPRFVYNWPMADEPVRRILETRPDHLLPPGHDDWTAFLRAVLVEAIDDVERRHGRIDVAWGSVNRASIRHPLTRAVPQLSRLLDMPADPLPGWRASVRVGTPSYAATLRMACTCRAARAGTCSRRTMTTGTSHGSRAASPRSRPARRFRASRSNHDACPRRRLRARWPVNGLSRVQ
jgi:penicillin amidase